MIKVRHLAALLTVAALPACSMFGGGDSNRSARAGAPGQSTAAVAPSPQPAATQAPLTPEMIRNVQDTLRKQGTYHGRVDGVWGPGTQAAVRDYQQQHNLNTSGQLDQETLSAMNLAGANDANYSPNPNAPPSPNPPPSNVNPPPGTTPR